jgi:Ca2+-binding RTX toxin-like protein
VLGIAGLNSANIEIQGNQITNVAEAILGQEDSSFSSGAFLPPWAIGATNIVVNATQQALDFEVDPANPHAFNITGTTGNDLIIGGAGNDIINGSGGADVLTGGGGANTFVFDNNALSSAKQATPGIAEVTDFNASPQNQVDLSALLDAAFSSGQQANNLVQVTEDPSHNFSTLSVNVGGTATPNQFVAIAHLDNVHTGAVVTAVLDHAQHTAQVHVG